MACRPLADQLAAAIAEIEALKARLGLAGLAIMELDATLQQLLVTRDAVVRLTLG